jgi:ligand-binding SRPBCC domain-containing protein
MSLYTLERKSVLPTTLDKAWVFFSDPRNLSFITPAEMDFEIQSPLKAGDFYPGMLIEYVVRPFGGIRFRWVSEIQKIEEMKYFQDLQLVGPYAYWLHRHEFREIGSGVEMKDVVEYRMPYGWFGVLLHSLFRKLNSCSKKEMQRNFISLKAVCIAANGDGQIH